MVSHDSKTLLQSQRQLVVLEQRGLQGGLVYRAVVWYGQSEGANTQHGAGTAGAMCLEGLPERESSVGAPWARPTATPSAPCTGT